MVAVAADLTAVVVAEVTAAADHTVQSAAVTTVVVAVEFMDQSAVVITADQSVAIMAAEITVDQLVATTVAEITADLAIMAAAATTAVAVITAADTDSLTTADSTTDTAGILAQEWDINIMIQSVSTTVDTTGLIGIALIGFVRFSTGTGQLFTQSLAYPKTLSATSTLLLKTATAA